MLAQGAALAKSFRGRMAPRICGPLLSMTHLARSPMAAHVISARAMAVHCSHHELRQIFQRSACLDLEHDAEAFCVQGFQLRAQRFDRFRPQLRPARIHQHPDVAPLRLRTRRSGSRNGMCPARPAFDRSRPDSARSADTGTMDG